MVNDWPQLGWSSEVTICFENGPRDKSARILDRALSLSKAVPYNVTLRWLFYGLWQEGWFSDIQGTTRANPKKRAYETFASLMSRLRHSSTEILERWPIVLADDRRDPIHRTSGLCDETEWLNTEIDTISCNIDKMVGQRSYVMVAFEAEAMQSQFIYYTKEYGVSLWPFSGATSIPYKQRLASHIEWASDCFKLHVSVLYFGDYDPAGLTIPESAFRHVRKWCDVGFTAFRVGLNPDQIKEYQIQDDPEKPGKYQWEAVSDPAAGAIITGALDSLLCLDTIKKLESTETAMTAKVKQVLATIQ